MKAFPELYDVQISPLVHPAVPDDCIDWWIRSPQRPHGTKGPINDSNS